MIALFTRVSGEPGPGHVVAKRPSRRERASEDTTRIVEKHPRRVLGWVGGVGAAASSNIPPSIGNAIRIPLGLTAGPLLVLTAIFVWAFLTARHHQLEDRVGGLQDEIQELSAMVKPDATVFRIALRYLREEIQDNHRLMKQAVEHGAYWKLTENAPATKQWKKHHELFRQEQSYEELYEAERVAAQEVERILQARSVRTVLKRNRKVLADDRLPDVVNLLAELERDLDKAVERADRGVAL